MWLFCRYGRKFRGWFNRRPFGCCAAILRPLTHSTVNSTVGPLLPCTTMQSLRFYLTRSSDFSFHNFSNHNILEYRKYCAWSIYHNTIKSKVELSLRNNLVRSYTDLNIYKILWILMKYFDQSVTN